MRQKLGQHFLINETVLKGISAAVDPQPGETIIEIGPGHGELTEKIISLSPELKSGKEKLILIERDSELIAPLKQKFPKVQIIEGDVLKILPDLSSSLSDSPYALIGNLPYYLTGFLMRTISELENKPVRSIFTIQKEVAERMVEEPPRMNRLSAAVRFWAEPRILGLISKKDFVPPPEVDSATIELKTREPQPSGEDFTRFDAALKALFAHPRKTIVNNLMAAKEISREDLGDKLKKMDIDPEDRPQNLSIADIVKIGEMLA